MSATVLSRVTTDRPDDLAGPQVRLMYVLPSDGVDRALDTDGTIAGSTASAQAWLATQTPGLALRIDTSGGALDIGFFRLAKTDAAVAALGAFARDEIEAEMKAAGFSAPGKIYGVYYDGSGSASCGGGAWPPTLPGNVSALYLKAAVPGVPPCSANPFSNGGQPGYWEFVFVHEVLHTIGIVASCAPHHTRAGHVSDDNRDLMYAGDQPWQPSILDIGHDDYYKHSIPGCLDLAISGYLGAYPPPPVKTSTTTSTSPAAIVSIVRLNLTPNPPRAGRIETVRAVMSIKSVPNRVTCGAKIGSRLLGRATHSARVGSATCSWRIPEGTRGHTLSGTITALSGRRSITRRFTARIA